MTPRWRLLLPALLACLVLSSCTSDTPVAEGDSVVHYAGPVDLVDSGVVVVNAPAPWNALWTAIVGDEDLPDINFEQSVVVLHVQSYGSGCEPIFHRVRIDADSFNAVEIQFVGLKPGTVCAADENSFATAVEIARSALPDGATIGFGDQQVPIG